MRTTFYTNLFFKILILFFLPFFISCNKNIQPEEKQIKEPIISNCGCDSLWIKNEAKAFVNILEKTTRVNHLIWPGYQIGDGTYVLNAGQTADSTYCLGLWQGGRALSYKCSKDIPKMLTPLYSYYLNYGNEKKKEDIFFNTHKGAPDFTAWMQQNSIKTAVYMPVSFPDFPFEIPPKTKTQLAIHEAFHIEVMLEYWYTEQGHWPAWDQQPDRSQLNLCYTQNDIVAELIQKEQELLVQLIEALLDSKKGIAKKLGNEFLKIRTQRYQELEEVSINADEENTIDCQTAETIMEIEEGIADYASWVQMFELELFNRQDLIKRYRALQKDKFYLTGCMMLQAATLMNNGNDQEIITKIINAPSVVEGNLTTIFKYYLDRYGE